MTRLLMVGAGNMGAGYIDAALRRGFDVALVERERWFEVYRGRVSQLFGCPASDDQYWVAAAREAADAWQPDLVIAFAEPQVLAAAWVQDALGLPGPGLRAASASRDKGLQRTLGARAGVPQPEFVLTSDPARAADFARDRYPVMVKALRSSGSLGVVSAESESDLLRTLAGRSGQEAVLIEDRVDGPEFSCEMLVVDGEIRFQNLTLKRTTGPPEFVEVAHVLPADPGDRARAAVAAAVAATIKALDVRTSLVHLEFRLLGGRAFVLETAVRTPGDHIMELLGHAYGIDMFDEVLSCYAGSPSVSATPQGCAGIQYLLPRPGLVTDVRGGSAAAAPGVQRLHLPYRIGQEIASARSSGERGGYVIATGPTESAVVSALAAASDGIEVRTR